MFAERITTDFTDHAALVGHCDTCGQLSAAVRDCTDESCIAQFVRCDACFAADGVCTKVSV